MPRRNVRPCTSVNRKDKGEMGRLMDLQSLAESLAVVVRVPFSTSSVKSSEASPTIGSSCQGIGSRTRAMAWAGRMMARFK